MITLEAPVFSALMVAPESSPTPPSGTSNTSPRSASSSERAKSPAASACLSGVPDKAAIRHKANIIQRHTKSTSKAHPFRMARFKSRCDPRGGRINQCCRDRRGVLRTPKALPWAGLLLALRAFRRIQRASTGDPALGGCRFASRATAGSEVTRIARSWRHARRRYRSGCLAVRSSDLKVSRFTNNEEFEQNRISYGQPGFGRWKGPFRSVSIGKKRKPSHIISSGPMADSARGCVAKRRRGLQGRRC